MQKEFLPYVRLVEFLGKVLGRHTEVVLHDLTNLDQSIIAIANGHISGRKIGAPATDLALRIVSNEALKQKDYLCKYTGYAKNGYKLCSSTFFIRDGSERLIGMLCINTDSERLEQARDILDSMLSDRDCCCQNGATEDISEKLSLNAEELTLQSIAKAVENLGVDPERMSPQEKIDIVRKLNDTGVFLLKGSVAQTAATLKISEPSVYRYLNQIKKKSN